MVANIVYYHHHCDHIHLSGRAAAGCKPFGGHLSEYLASLSQPRSAHSLGNVIIICTLSDPSLYLHLLVNRTLISSKYRVFF